MDVQSIDRLPDIASRAPEKGQWLAAARVGEVGRAATMSASVQDLLDRYNGLAKLYNAFGPSMFAFAKAQLWHDERDRSESVDTIMAKEQSDRRLRGKVDALFDSKNDSTRIGYLARAFGHLREKGSLNAGKFYGDLKSLLAVAAQLPPSVKKDLRKATNYQIDAKLKYYLQIIGGSNVDWAHWQRFHRN